MKLYKLTDEDGYTYNFTHWEVGKTVKANGVGVAELCTDTVLHAYTDPILAEILNPVYSNFPKSKRLFEVEGVVVVKDATTVGCRELTVIREIDVPPMSRTQKLAFGILCSLEVYKKSFFVSWAEKWLSGEDRTRKSAKAVCETVGLFNSSASASSAASSAASVSDASSASAEAYYVCRPTYISFAVMYAIKTDPNLDLASIAKKVLSYV